MITNCFNSCYVMYLVAVYHLYKANKKDKGFFT